MPEHHRCRSCCARRSWRSRRMSPPAWVVVVCARAARVRRRGSAARRRASRVARRRQARDAAARRYPRARALGRLTTLRTRLVEVATLVQQTVRRIVHRLPARSASSTSSRASRSGSALRSRADDELAALFPKASHEVDEVRRDLVTHRITGPGGSRGREPLRASRSEARGRQMPTAVGSASRRARDARRRSTYPADP
jgi:hypothetical protein